MITVRRTVRSALDAGSAFAYLSEFEHTSEWDPGTPVVEKTSTGRAVVGSTYHAEAEFRGRRQPIDYVVTEIDAADGGRARIALHGENKTVTAIDTIEVEPAGSGSAVTYTAEFRLKGLAALATPFVKPLFERLGDPAAAGMKERLDAIAATGAEA